MIDLNLKRLIQKHGVSGALHIFVETIYDLERDLSRSEAPKSTRHEVAAAYRYSARAIDLVASRIRYRANRVGF